MLMDALFSTIKNDAGTANNNPGISVTATPSERQRGAGLANKIHFTPLKTQGQ
jgi:hypothetical protein